MTLRALFPRVEADERVRLLFAVAAFMCVASAGVIARTTGNTMFLSTFPAERLAPMYIASALLLMSISFGFGWLVSRAPLARLIMYSAMALVVATLILRIVSLTPWRGASVAVYLFSDVVAKLPALMFWAFAATMFDPRQAKRLFVIVGAGGTLACVFAGALIKPLVEGFGTENLLFPVALLLGGFGAIIWRWIQTHEAVEKTTKPSVARIGAGFRSYGDLLRLPQVRTLIMVVVIAAASLLLTDYLFKATARAHYVGEDLASFFGLFYSFSSLTALLIQIFLVHTIMKRGGVLFAALILPVSLLVTAMGVVMTGAFGWVIAAKFVDPVFDFTVNATAMQLLYLGIRKQSRSQARALVDGITRPLSTILAGAFLIAVAATIDPRMIAAIIAGASVLWALAAWRSCRAYVAGLLDSIGAHQFDPRQEAFTLDDKVVETHIREALRTASDEEVLYLLEIAGHMDQEELKQEYRALLSRKKPEIKVAALDYLRRHGTEEDVESVRAALHIESADVRKAAIRSISSLLGVDGTRDIQPLLEDADSEVRAAATIELINKGDLEGLLASCLSLQEMLRSEVDSTRAAATRALAHVNHQGLAKVLTELLGDPNPSVRRAALAACGRRPDPTLIPAILPILSDPDLAIVAADTLELFGSDVIPHFQSFPEQARSNPREELYLVPTVLAQTKDPEALPLLAGAIDSRNVRLRSKVVDAYCDLVCTLPPDSRPLETLKQAALREIGLSEERSETILNLSPYEDARLLTSILAEERHDLIGNAFRLIGTLHPQLNMRSILWAIRSGNKEKQSAALEVLDNVLEPELKRAILEVFERAAAAEETGQAEEEPVGRLLKEGHSEWVVASAAYTSGRHRVVTTVEPIRALLTSESPYVREAALDAFSRLAPRDEVIAVASSMITDPNETVSYLANRMLVEVKT